MALSQIKKKRKRKGLDLEAPEVISFKSFDILWATFSQLDPVLMTKCDTKVLIRFQGWDLCLAGQGAGEDSTREKSPREGEVQVLKFAKREARSPL